MGDPEKRDIGWAVKQLCGGHRITRRGWNGNGQYLEIQFPAPFSPDSPPSGMTLPYVFIRTVQGDRVPWLCSQTDLLAYDWESLTKDVPDA